MFSVTFNIIISVTYIAWQSVLPMEATDLPRVPNLKLYIEYTSLWVEDKRTTLVVFGADCIAIKVLYQCCFLVQHLNYIKVCIRVNCHKKICMSRSF